MRADAPVRAAITPFERRQEHGRGCRPHPDRNGDKTMAEGKRFKKEPRRYALTFEDGDLDGFECTMGAVSLAQFTDMTRLADELSTPAGRTPANIEAQFTFMARLLVSWNLDDDEDEPVPADYAGLQTLEFSFV